jgi:hypothetical protein
MSIVRTFEVTTTKKIRIVLPDVYDTPDILREWRESLWHIDGVDDMAEYAARLVAEGSAEYNNDGVGRMRTESEAEWRAGRGMTNSEFLVTYTELDCDISTELVE